MEVEDGTLRVFGRGVVSGSKSAFVASIRRFLGVNIIPMDIGGLAS
jgi:hypothetical protein